MGRAMLIICAGVMVSLGFVTISTSNQGKALTRSTVSNAEYVMAKNAAHTAIQMAMQEINQDDDWPDKFGSPSDAWEVNIDGIDVALWMDYDPSPAHEYWEPDYLRLYSNVEYLNEVLQVTAYYRKARFSSLVPKFEGALTFAADYDKYNFSASGSASISGNSPTSCPDTDDNNKPGIVVKPGPEGDENQSGKLSDISKIDVDADPPTAVKNDLSYQPTDELIARLANSPGVQHLSSDHKDNLGTESEPGVFFVNDYLKLNGKQTDGYGILVVRKDAEIEYEGDDGATLDVNGNFTWNGLIIFEDAYNFKGRGTPKINGSILVGHTDEYDGEPIDIDISGNIHFQYDCKGEDYAKMAAADAVKQNKYTRLTQTENIRYASSNSDDSLIDKIIKLF